MVCYSLADPCLHALSKGFFGRIVIVNKGLVRGDDVCAEIV
jgi:hypothetical protein